MTPLHKALVSLSLVYKTFFTYPLTYRPISIILILFYGRINV